LTSYIKDFQIRVSLSRLFRKIEPSVGIVAKANVHKKQIDPVRDSQRGKRLCRGRRRQRGMPLLAKVLFGKDADLFFILNDQDPCHETCLTPLTAELTLHNTTDRSPQ